MDLIAQLNAFVAVAENVSFTRGAESCGVPQPVVSRRVSALEKRLDGQLLRRTSRSVELTALGRAMLPYASDLVARANHLIEFAQTHAKEFVLALPPGADARGLVAGRRAAEAEGLALGFEERDPVDRAKALATGRVAAALTACPPDEALMSAVLGVGSAIDERRVRRVYLDQLRRRDAYDRPRRLHVDLEDDVPWIREPLRRAAAAAGLRADQIKLGSGRTEALTAAHEYGDLVLCTRRWAQRHHLRWRTLGDIDISRTYALARPSDDGLPPGLERAVGPLTRALGLEPHEGVLDATEDGAL